MGSEVTPQTNAGVFNKVRSVATEISHQVVNQFISLTSGQIAAYISNIGRFKTPEHNRYNRSPLNRTLHAEKQKSNQSPQQNSTVSKSIKETIAELAKKAEQFVSLYEIPSGTSAFYAVAFLSKLIDSAMAKEAINAHREQEVLA